MFRGLLLCSYYAVEHTVLEKNYAWLYSLQKTSPEFMKDSKVFGNVYHKNEMLT